MAGSLNNLAALYGEQKKYPQAIDYARRATAILQARATAKGDERSTGQQSEQKGHRSAFIQHVGLLQHLPSKNTGEAGKLAAEGFSVEQLAADTGAARALAQMAARFAAKGDDLAKLVRNRQDALASWQKLDADLVKHMGLAADKRDAATEARLRAQIKETDATMVRLDGELHQRFPEFAELTSSKPVPLADTQALLAPDEALLVYLVGDKESYLWVVRRDQAGMFPLDLTAKKLDEQVRFLRAALDPAGLESLADLRAFPLPAAQALYKTIFQPAEPLLAGVKHVMVVADGALQSLPLGVLVPTLPPKPVLRPQDHGQVEWLARRYAFTTLPAVGSLRALRRFAKAGRGTAPFTGFGDPLLDGKPGGTRGVALATLFRGAQADGSELRKLPRLPETAGELTALSKALGGAPGTLHLGAEATETLVKKTALQAYRVIAFATHGIMAREAKEFRGLAEPVLVLTPPQVPTAEDDGLLTASEVAQIPLNADWVLLSACNTAASDGSPNAEGLSGLAKAFFYAGSRALLVSHWSVQSEAAVALTTVAFKALNDDPKLGRAEALQRSMLALMQDAAHPYYAHPLFWAPFVVVGEGGPDARRATAAGSAAGGISPSPQPSPARGEGAVAPGATPPSAPAPAMPAAKSPTTAPISPALAPATATTTATVPAPAAPAPATKAAPAAAR